MSEPTLHKENTCTILAILHKQLCLKNLQHCLDLPGPTLHKEITYVMLAHGYQTTFMRKITYAYRPCWDLHGCNFIKKKLHHSCFKVKFAKFLRTLILKSKRLLPTMLSKYRWAETVAQRCSVKKVFLEISQNSQENTCAKVSILIKFQASGLKPFTSVCPAHQVDELVLVFYTPLC